MYTLSERQLLTSRSSNSSTMSVQALEQITRRRRGHEEEEDLTYRGSAARGGHRIAETDFSLEPVVASVNRQSTSHIRVERIRAECWKACPHASPCEL